MKYLTTEELKVASIEVLLVEHKRYAKQFDEMQNHKKASQLLIEGMFKNTNKDMSYHIDVVHELWQRGVLHMLYSWELFRDGKLVYREKK